MAEISDYNVAAGSNTSAAPAGAPEGMAPSDVNDTMREMMARLKRWYNDLGGANDSAGSANAYTLAASQTITAYAEGQIYTFEASFSNTGAATLNVDAVGAKAIVKGYNLPLTTGDILAGQMVTVVYEATADNFQVLSALGLSVATGGTFTPVLTYATPGDLVVVDASGTGLYTKIGNVVIATFGISTSTHTFTTASGQMRVTGLPFTVAATGATARSALGLWSGITKTNYTVIEAIASPGTTYLNIRASGSGQTNAAVTTSDVASGTNIALGGGIIYWV